MVKPRIYDVTRLLRCTLVTLGCAVVGCSNGGGVFPPEPATLDELLVNARGFAPAEARLAYPVEATCSPPAWSDLHPDEPGDWPTFRPAEMAEVARAHELLGNLAVAPLVVVREPSFTEGLETEAVSLLLLSTWAGTDFDCEGTAITEALIVRSGLGSSAAAPEELFNAVSQQTDERGIDALNDLDVVLRESDE